MPNPRSRNFFIDLLRGLSILSVMSMHVGLPAWVTARAPHWMTSSLGNSYYGVTVFFVISGYLIAMTCIKRFGSLGDIDLRKFVIFRFGRIVPFLVIVLALLITLGLHDAKGFVMSGDTSLTDAASAVLSFQFNGWYWTCSQHCTGQAEAWAPMWSLSIEELFYVFFPVVCVTLRSRTALVMWLLLALPFSLYTRATTHGLFFFSSCVDALSVGVLTALLADHKPPKENATLSVLGMALGLGGIFYVCQTHPTANIKWGPLSCALAAGLFIYSSLRVPARLLTAEGAAARAVRRTLGLPFLLLSLLGRCSYEAYLLHMPARIFVTNYLWKDRDGVVVILAIGVLSYGLNTFFTEPLNEIVRGGAPAATVSPARWKKLLAPIFAAAILVGVPNVIVEIASRRHAVASRGPQRKDDLAVGATSTVHSWRKDQL